MRYIVFVCVPPVQNTVYFSNCVCVCACVCVCVCNKRVIIHRKNSLKIWWPVLGEVANCLLFLIRELLATHKNHKFFSYDAILLPGLILILVYIYIYIYLHVIVYVNSILHLVSQLQGGTVVPCPS